MSSRLSGPERRQAVVETACRVFAKSSYRGSTTAQIARETGVTEPVLYRHFASKRELYLACLDAVWERVRALWEKALEREPDPTNWLRSIGKAYLEERGAARIVLVDLWIQSLTEAADDPEIRRALRAQLRDVHNFVADVNRRLSKKKAPGCGSRGFWFLRSLERRRPEGLGSAAQPQPPGLPSPSLARPLHPISLASGWVQGGRNIDLSGAVVK